MSVYRCDATPHVEDFADLLTERFLAHQQDLLLAERSARQQLQREMDDKTAAYDKLARAMAERQRLQRAVEEVGEGTAGGGVRAHDGICQRSTGARLRIQVAECALAERKDTLRSEELHRIMELVDECLEQAYDLSRGLDGPQLRPNELGASLLALAARVRETHEVDCEARADDIDGLASGFTATQQHRIAQEAVNNALKHAGANAIDIQLTQSDGSITLRVQDDGRGMSVRSTSPGAPACARSCR
ncbi:MAG: sensor histidine kinase [Myxococcota bacterium]